jgi:hypothetical protein
MIEVVKSRPCPVHPDQMCEPKVPIEAPETLVYTCKAPAAQHVWYELCACPEGPYFGARAAHLIPICERCKRIPQDLDFPGE